MARLVAVAGFAAVVLLLLSAIGTVEARLTARAASRPMLLDEAWSATLGPAANSAPVLTPDESAVLLTSRDARLHAFEAATGAMFWGRPTTLPNASTCEVAFAKELALAFVVLADGVICSVNVTSGAIVNAAVARLPVASAVNGCQPVYASETGLLYVTVPPVMWAVDVASGAVAWTAPGTSPPSVVDGVAWLSTPVNSGEASVAILNATTGVEVAVYASRGTITPGPFGRPSVFGSRGDGWTALFSSNTSFVYGEMPANMSKFVVGFETAIDAPNSNPAFIYDAYWYERGVTLVGTANSQLVALNPVRNESLWWAANLSAPAATTPSLGGYERYAFVGDVNGRIYAFNTYDGEQLATARLPGGSFRPRSTLPVSFKAELMFAATAGGTLSARHVSASVPIVEHRCSSTDCAAGTCNERVEFAEGCDAVSASRWVQRLCNATAAEGATLKVSDFSNMVCDGKPSATRMFAVGKCYADGSGRGSFKITGCPPWRG